MANVLVVGATSAIASAASALLAARGDRLYLVGRDTDKLAHVEQALGDSVVGSEALDVTEPGAGILVDRAWSALGSVDLALICHGWLPDQQQTERDVDLAEECFRVNLLSVVALLMPLADRMEAQRHGTIGVVTSVAGMRGRPRNFTYGAAKAGVSTYLCGLRSRLWPSGVRVVDLRPGPIVSPMTKGHKPNLLFSTPDRIAPAIVRALDRGRRVQFLPWYWGPLMAIIVRVPEPIFQRFGFLAGR